jgi:predicted nucleic acid-binding protein
MRILIDTNLLTRLVQPGHPHQATALRALDALHARDETLCLVPQVLYEFWTVCTRPTDQNGLGLNVPAAAGELAQAKSLFVLLEEIPDIYAHWERLVIQYDVKGKNAHDARLVAAMMAQGISHLLTFNARDFTRYAEITLLAPEEVA